MSTLEKFYNEKKISNFEGFSQQVEEQTTFLKNIANNPSIKYVMEIGFNGGHSSELFFIFK